MIREAIIFGSLVCSVHLFAATVKVDIVMKYADLHIKESCFVEDGERVELKHFPITISLKSHEESDGNTLLSAKVYAQVHGRKTLLASPILLLNKEEAGELVLGDAIKDDSVYLKITASAV